MSSNGPGDSARRPLYLCSGPQSSGSTLISWCFLQRRDMDGVLDARGDLLPAVPAGIAAQNIWCKTTISCFRLAEMIEHLRDEGWDVRPLLIVRDVRAVFNSLIAKSYGRNGTTAEEPPLRLRLRRFHQDWQFARRNGWPILRYESFVAEPEQELRRACAAMGLPWDEAMVNWPKPSRDMAAPVHGNPTFRLTCGRSLTATLSPSLAEVRTDRIPPDDLRWLERTFADFNAAHDYRPQVAPAAWNGAERRAVPRYENTRRYGRKKGKLRLLHRLWPG